MPVITMTHCEKCGDKWKPGVSHYCSESRSNDLLSVLHGLIAEWETEANFLNNPHDDSADKMVGKTYKQCADELRRAINR